MWFREKMRYWSIHGTRFTYWLSHKVFRWVQDDEGDIGLEMFGLITFVKYKEHTLVEWFKRHYRNAERWQGRGELDHSYQELKEVAEHWDEEEDR